MWFLSSLLVVAALAAVALFVGGALLRLTGARRGPATPESCAAAALLGGGALMLLFGWLSHAGVAGWRAGPATLALALLLGGVIRWRLPCAAAGGWRRLSPAAGLLLIALAGAALALLPVARFNAFNPYNDTFTYISISDHLQAHAFSEPASPDPASPFLSQTKLYQDVGLRMGATFLLALVQSFAPGRRAIEFYPALAAWGVALNVLAVFLLCRWGIRLDRRRAFAAAWLAAVIPNPFHYAAANGFLPQLIGTAFFVLALAWLARLARGGRHGAAAGLAFTLAALASAYSELMIPALLIAGAVFALRMIPERGRAGRARVWGLAVLLALLFTNLEIARMMRALPSQIHALVGMPIAYRPLEFLGAALGANPGPWEPSNVHVLWRYSPGLDNALAALLGLLALWGLAALLRRVAVRAGYFTALLFMASLFLWFALVERGPVRPSWSEFKITQWAYPLLLPLLVAGAAALPRPRFMLGALLLLTTGAGIRVHGRISRVESGNALAWTGADAAASPFANHPFAAYAALADAVDRLQPEGIVELRFSPARMQHRQLVVYYLAPRQLIGDWRNDGYLIIKMKPENQNLQLPEPHLVLEDAADPEKAELPAGVAQARLQ
jgi:hypothetical protein